MFDADIKYDPRLAAECGIKNHLDFAPKKECDEQELKYLIYQRPISTFNRIESAILAQGNRVIDPRSYERKEGALITLNLDTQDQKLAKAGFSLRVRYQYDSEAADNIRSIDMCIKTLMVANTDLVMFLQHRGEWEIELPTLRPDMGRMIAENRFKNPPLPVFFTWEGIKNDDLFVESIGCTLRESFNSYETISNGALSQQPFAAVFQHTADLINIFTTPYADIITREDREAEAEFTGFWGLKPGHFRPDEFEHHMRASMRAMDSIIMGSAPFCLKRNTISKASRARNALEPYYADLDNGPLARSFGAVSSGADHASHYALKQGVRPEDVNVDNLWNQIARMRSRLEREREIPENRSFETMRLAR